MPADCLHSDESLVQGPLNNDNAYMQYGTGSPAAAAPPPADAGGQLISMGDLTGGPSAEEPLREGLTHGAGPGPGPYRSAIHTKGQAIGNLSAMDRQ